MSITIKKIAELSNTSRGTVDRVLNKRGNVSKEVEKRVLDVVKEYNYQYNPYARALVNSKKKNIIGVVINSIGNEFFDKVIEGIKDSIKSYKSMGIELEMIELKGYIIKEQINAIDTLLKKGINALAITPINNKEIETKLKSLDIPIVTFNNDIDIEKLAFVGCDYYNNGLLCGDLANLMMEKGNAIIVTGSLLQKGHNERIKGFKDSFLNNGNNKIIEILENNDDENISYNLVKESINKYNIDLIYFGAGGIKGGLKAVTESNQRIKIITVDETNTVVDNLKKGIIYATVTQQPYKQGYKTIEILCDKLLLKKKPKNIIQYTGNRIKLKNSKFFELEN